MSFIDFEELKRLDKTTEEFRIASILSALKMSWDSLEALGALTESDCDYLVCSHAQVVLEDELKITVSDEEIFNHLKILYEINR